MAFCALSRDKVRCVATITTEASLALARETRRGEKTASVTEKFMIGRFLHAQESAAALFRL